MASLKPGLEWAWDDGDNHSLLRSPYGVCCFAAAGPRLPYFTAAAAKAAPAENGRQPRISSLYEDKGLFPHTHTTHTHKVVWP